MGFVDRHLFHFVIFFYIIINALVVFAFLHETEWINSDLWLVGAIICVIIGVADGFGIPWIIVLKVFKIGG